MRAEGQRPLPSHLLPSGGNSDLQVVRGVRAAALRPLEAVGRNFAGSALKTIYLLITIMVLASSHPHLAGQQVTTQAPAGAERGAELPDGPEAVRFPDAQMLPPVDETTPVVIESDTQSKAGSVYTLDGNVVITSRDRVVQADHIEYNSDTGELTATGHLKATGGVNHESISASHGTMNLIKQTGRFYDVSGSVGLKSSGQKMTYASSNPFLFTGRVVVKTGPQEYEVIGGTVTSCQLEHPDWLLYAGKFTLDSEKARAQNSVFHLLNIPVLYLPYVTHPVDSADRQSGFMIPVVGESSTKGLVLGEQIYWAINRSTDLMVGAEYFSSRGWAQSAAFRYRGLGNDFVTARYRGLLDRGFVTGGVYVNQGGQDVTFSGRHDFTAYTRVVGDVEYLSSYPYREAFTENFNQAVSSDIHSFAYGVHEANGYAASLLADRYQGLKRVGTPLVSEQQVRIFHSPSAELATTEHRLGRTGLEWSLESSAAGLKRVQPAFATSGITERFDVHPELAYPLTFAGWHVRPSVAVRDTVYSRSRHAPLFPGGPPVQIQSGVNRADVEVHADIRTPVVERTFDSRPVEKLFHHDVKHTIEPEVTYRYVSGVNNFSKVLRFDDVDIVSDTNEVEYGVTQRLFLRPLKSEACKEGEADADSDLDKEGEADAALSGCGSREWITWRLGQKYFFDDRFGGAVVKGRRNLFDTTLSFSGIAFLTEPRDISPLISRLRVRTSAHTDVEWDFDLDTGAKKFTSNNVLVDVREGNTFAGLSYARLNAPGRFYTEGISSSVSDFSQLRLLVGYGSPTKRGMGVAANVGLDLNLGMVQYGALQTSYNWDCCGLSVEYRKYELGSVRNENAYRFNFTLANIGTAGNLRRAERLF